MASTACSRRFAPGPRRSDSFKYDMKKPRRSRRVDTLAEVIRGMNVLDVAHIEAPTTTCPLPVANGCCCPPSAMRTTARAHHHRRVQLPGADHPNHEQAACALGRRSQARPGPRGNMNEVIVVTGASA